MHTVSITDRPIDILFCGGYTTEDDAVAVFNKLEGFLSKTDGDYGQLASLFELFKTDYTISPYDLFNKFLRQNGVKGRTEQYAGMFRRLSFSLELYRHWYRDETLKRLLAAGLDVTVYGKGWERFEGFGHKHFHYMGECSYDESVDLMTRAKIALNVSPMYKHGGHERIFTAMLNGAACLSTITYAFDDIVDNENILFYDLNDFDAAVSSIKDLLTNPARWQHITNAAYELADKKHRWANRADQILAIMAAKIR